MTLLLDTHAFIWWMKTRRGWDKRPMPLATIKLASTGYISQGSALDRSKL